MAEPCLAILFPCHALAMKLVSLVRVLLGVYVGMRPAEESIFLLLAWADVGAEESLFIALRNSCLVATHKTNIRLLWLCFYRV